jgi:hypothetical protein
MVNAYSISRVWSPSWSPWNDPAGEAASERPAYSPAYSIGADGQPASQRTASIRRSSQDHAPSCSVLPAPRRRGRWASGGRQRRGLRWGADRVAPGGRWAGPRDWAARSLGAAFVDGVLNIFRYGTFLDPRAGCGRTIASKGFSPRMYADSRRCCECGSAFGGRYRLRFSGYEWAWCRFCGEGL